jgi:ABC-type nitrate/sulfonate/bicarbonate transport system permease component
MNSRPGGGRLSGRGGQLASRAVQAAFVVVLLGLWYFGTTRWHISPILLPNPVAV